MQCLRDFIHDSIAEGLIMNRVTDMITEKDTRTAGNSILLILIFITIFVVPLFPLQFHPLLFNLLYTAIFLVAAFSLQKHRQNPHVYGVRAVRCLQHPGKTHQIH